MTLFAHRGRCPRCGNDPKGTAEFKAARAADQSPAPGAGTVPYAKFAELLRQEHALSDAYVRLREIIGAMDPPTVSDSAQLWAYVESVAREKLASATSPAVGADGVVLMRVGDPQKMQPTYYVEHPDGSHSVADPQPVVFKAAKETAK